MGSRYMYSSQNVIGDDYMRYDTQCWSSIFLLVDSALLQTFLFQKCSGIILKLPAENSIETWKGNVPIL